MLSAYPSAWSGMGDADYVYLVLETPFSENYGL